GYENPISSILLIIVILLLRHLRYLKSNLQLLLRRVLSQKKSLDRFPPHRVPLFSIFNLPTPSHLSVFVCRGFRWVRRSQTRVPLPRRGSQVGKILLKNPKRRSFLSLRCLQAWIRKRINPRKALLHPEPGLLLRRILPTVTWIFLLLRTKTKEILMRSRDRLKPGGS
ncbi:hypothetical protein IGI04_037547, partial [Brassica rapa subsp. trilocularis]